MFESLKVTAVYHCNDVWESVRNGAMQSENVGSCGKRDIVWSIISVLGISPTLHHQQ